MWNLPVKCISSGLQDLTRVKLCRRICERCSRHPNILMDLDYFTSLHISSLLRSKLFQALVFQGAVTTCEMEQPVFEGRPGKLPHWASNLEENVPWTNREHLNRLNLHPVSSIQYESWQAWYHRILLRIRLNTTNPQESASNVSNPEKIRCRFADEQLVMIWKISEVSRSVMLSQWGRQEIANHFAWRSKTRRLAEDHPRYIRECVWIWSKEV